MDDFNIITVFDVFDKIRKLENILFLDDLNQQASDFRRITLTPENPNYQMTPPEAFSVLTKEQRSIVQFNLDLLKGSFKEWQEIFKNGRILNLVLTGLIDSLAKNGYYNLNGTYRPNSDIGWFFIINAEWTEKQLVETLAASVVPIMDLPKPFYLKVRKKGQIKFFVNKETLEIFLPGDLVPKTIIPQPFKFGSSDYLKYKKIYPNLFYNGYLERYMVWGEPGLEESPLQLFDLIFLPKLIIELGVYLLRNAPNFVIRLGKSAISTLSKIKTVKIPSLIDFGGIAKEEFALATGKGGVAEGGLMDGRGTRGTFATELSEEQRLTSGRTGEVDSKIDELNKIPKPASPDKSPSPFKELKGGLQKTVPIQAGREAENWWRHKLGSPNNPGVDQGGRFATPYKYKGSNNVEPDFIPAIDSSGKTVFGRNPEYATRHGVPSISDSLLVADSKYLGVLSDDVKNITFGRLGPVKANQVKGMIWLGGETKGKIFVFLIRPGQQIGKDILDFAKSIKVEIGTRFIDEPLP